MSTIVYNDNKFTYDAKIFNTWKFQKAISGAMGEGEGFKALDALLCNKSDEYAEALGGTMEDIAGLLEAIAKKETHAKN